MKINCDLDIPPSWTYCELDALYSCGWWLRKQGKVYFIPDNTVQEFYFWKQPRWRTESADLKNCTNPERYRKWTDLTPRSLVYHLTPEERLFLEARKMEQLL